MSRPELLIFTRGADREAACRRLLPGRLRSVERALHQRCLAAALEAGGEAGWSITVASPRPLPLPVDVGSLTQSGDGFAERLVSSIRRVRARRPGPLVVVGTDVPGLTGDHLRRAEAYLRREPDSVVLGPSPDGGFYLLASARPIEEELGRVRWCRPDTLRRLVKELRDSGIRVVFLDPLQDLDHPRDLESWLSHRRPASAGWRGVVGLLRRALASLKRPGPAPAPGVSPLLVPALPDDRAPPLRA